VPLIEKAIPNLFALVEIISRNCREPSNGSLILDGKGSHREPELAVIGNRHGDDDCVAAPHNYCVTRDAEATYCRETIHFSSGK
jgi:hypothetical protein